MDHIGRTAFHIQSETYNKTRLLLGYFSLIVINFKDVQIIQISFTFLEYMEIITKYLLYHQFDGTIVDLI